MLRMIPGLERAEFLQFGQIHRNTYINAPRVLAATMQMRSASNLFFAGQITGVEGYVESVAMGWLAGNNAALHSQGKELLLAPPRSAIGALARYVSGAETKNYQPVNITFALLEPLGVALHAIPGVIEHGLFFGMARAAIVGSATGVRILGELP